MDITHTFNRGTESVYVEIVADTACFLVQNPSGESPTSSYSPEEFLSVCTAEDIKQYGTTLTAEEPYRTATLKTVFPSTARYHEFRVQLHEDLTEFAGENLDWSWSDETVETVEIEDSGSRDGPFFFAQEVS